MALDPRIPLGVQPIQQPNMLAQYGQMMALKAAQQETEGYEGVRQALSGGAPDDPTKLLQYGKQGRATYESLIKGRKEQVESAEKKLTLAGQVAGYVRDNPTPENFTTAVSTLLTNGILTDQQAQKVIADAGDDPVKIKMYAERAASDAVKEADRLSARTRLQAANISAAPGHARNTLEREKFNLGQERERAIQNVLADQVAPQNASAPNVNALTGDGAVQQQVAQIDARIQQLVGLGTPDALRAADVLFKQRNAISPSTGAVPGSIQEFNLARQQGFAGTFMDFQTERAALTAYGQPTEVSRTLPDGSTVVDMVYPNPVQKTLTPLSSLKTPPAPQAAPSASGSTAPVQKPATVEKINVNNSELNRVTTAIDATINTINDIIGDPSKKTGPAPGLSSATGPIMSRLPTVRTETANVEADMQSLEAKTSILGLRDIRKDAAVGSITEKEWPRFESYLAALARSQGTPQYIERAKEFRTYLEGIKKQAVESTTKANKALGGGAATPATTGDIATDPDIQSLLNKYK